MTRMAPTSGSTTHPTPVVSDTVPGYEPPQVRCVGDLVKDTTDTFDPGGFDAMLGDGFLPSMPS